MLVVAAQGLREEEGFPRLRRRLRHQHELAGDDRVTSRVPLRAENVARREPTQLARAGVRRAPAHGLVRLRLQVLEGAGPGEKGRYCVAGYGVVGG